LSKERLDLILVNKGYYPTREKAKAAIMSGNVFINGEKEDKPGAKFDDDIIIEIKQNPLPYVSRGGLKLEKALREFEIDLQDKVALDIGASTGGFTDCMLKNGARKVYAIDVGYGQLAWELRKDPRVVCMERTNIRYVTLEDIGEEADFASIDVSFISLKKVVPVVKNLLAEGSSIICLIKPQFEAGRDKVGKHGVVRDKNIHFDVLVDVLNFCGNEGLKISNVTFSPIKGPEGNIEFLAHLEKNNFFCSNSDFADICRQVVDSAHKNL